MKSIAIILVLFLLGCKNEIKTKTLVEPETQSEAIMETENGIDKYVYDMWHQYIELNPELKVVDIPESDFFHNNRKDANRLAELTLKGKKKASSGLYSLYKRYDVALPKVGTQQIITDFDGKAIAIIENKRIDTIPFNKITEEYAALDMGTDIEPLRKWKKAHWTFFENVLKESGEQPTEEMLVVCVRFETIWPKE